MTESDSPRLGLRRWSAGTDTPSRTEFDNGHANLDLLTAIDKQDIFANRPAAGVRGTYFWDTTNLYLWRDDGTGWSTVGSRTLDAIIKSSVAGNVPLTIDTPSSPSTDLLQVKANGTVKFSVGNGGLITAVGRIAATGVTYTNDTAANRVIDVTAANGQSTDILRLRNFGGTNMLTVNQNGVVSGAYLNAGAAQALLGNSAYSNVANLAKFSGTPALEVYAATGGASSTFTDFLYLRHQAPDTTATLRRLGILMKVGDENVGDAQSTGAIYIESSAASFANPKLVLNRANADVMTFDSTPLATILIPLSVSGRVTAANGTDFSYVMGNANLSTQGSHMALRAGSGAGFYFYSGGTYSNSAGTPGTGGTQVGQLDTNGLLSVASIALSNTNPASLVQANPAFIIGPSGAANLILDRSTVQARNNSIGAALNLNTNGGAVNLGSSGQAVTVNGNLFLSNGSKFSISATAPASPATGDVYVDIS